MLNSLCAMPLRPPEPARAWLLAACLAMASLPAPAQPAAAPAPPSAPPSAPASAPTRDQVDELARALRSEPGLLGSRKVRQLHFKDGDKPKEMKPSEDPSWFAWLRDFFVWFNSVGRWFMWALIAMAVALLLLRLWRLLGGHVPSVGERALQLPTQVRGLDIRPDSLPEDIGSAAWQLWQAGEQLAALSLLYRGALSQLVHGHAVPIRASSTEGDCLQLAQPRLAAPAHGYLAALVRAWGQAVYAQRWPQTDEVRRLCDQFTQLRPAAGAGATA